LSEAVKIAESSKKIVPLRPDAVPPDKMLVTLNVGELRELISDLVEQKLRRFSTSRPGGLLNAEQAAEYLGYSKDWVYKNWHKIGGKRIGGKGLRFDASELQKWVESRNGA
jgi:excisionase family DNA binding protein